MTTRTGPGAAGLISVPTGPGAGAVPVVLFRRAPAVPVIHSKRSRAQSEDDITTHTMRLRAIAQDPAIYLSSHAYTPRPPRSPGRPGDYPHWAYAVLNALIGPCESLRQAAATVQDPAVWQWFVDGARTHLGDTAADGVPRRGPKRHHWYTWASTYGALHLAPLGDAFRDLALAQAIRQGLLDVDAPGTTSRPHRSTVVTGDGKVMNSPCRNTTGVRVDPRTGDVIGTQRVDPASGYHTEGTGETVWGSKNVILSARNDNYYGRVICDIESQEPETGHGGEAGLATRMLLRLRAAAGPGMRGVAYDGALNGVHIDQLIRAGLLVASPVIAQSNPDNEKTGGKNRIEKSHVIDGVTYADTDGQCEHDLYAIGGYTHEKIILDDGSAHYNALPYRLKSPSGHDDRHRWHHEVTVPCDHGSDHEILVPLHITKEDRKRGFNRPEYLRQLPPGFDYYDRVYGWRPDAESLNCQVEARFYFHRLPAYGLARQRLILIGLAQSENAVSRYHHQARQDASNDPPGLTAAA